MSDATPDSRHAEKMAKKKTARDKMLAGKTREGGLLMVHTGKGKGKTTAAIGLALRAMGNGQKVCIIQFIKGAWDTGERKILEQFPDLCTITAMGEGFTWDTQNRERDITTARTAWEAACAAMADPAHDMVILDEINIVLRYDYLPVEEVMEVLQNRRANLHVVATGRNAKQELMDAADMVTEMTQIRHHFRDGYKAQQGIEF